jgi:hypothetical protein
MPPLKCQCGRELTGDTTCVECGLPMCITCLRINDRCYLCGVEDGIILGHADEEGDETVDIYD